MITTKKKKIQVLVEIETETEFEDGEQTGPEFASITSVKVDGEVVEKEEHTFSQSTWTLWDNESGRSFTLEEREY